MSRNRGFSKVTHKGAQVISLLKGTFAHQNNVGKIPPDLAKEFRANFTFTEEQAIKRVLIISGLLLQRIERLR